MQNNRYRNNGQRAFGRAVGQTSAAGWRIKEVDFPDDIFRPGHVFVARKYQKEGNSSQLRINTHRTGLNLAIGCSFPEVENRYNLPILHGYELGQPYKDTLDHEMLLDSQDQRFGRRYTEEEAMIPFNEMDCFACTSEFFPAKRDTNITIINKDVSFEPDLWEQIIAHRLNALMWSPQIQMNGPYNADSEYIGIQLPFDYRVRHEIGEQSKLQYNYPVAPDVQNGDDDFKYKTAWTDHGVSCDRIKRIAMDVFADKAERFIYDRRAIDRIANMIWDAPRIPLPEDEADISPA